MTWVNFNDLKHILSLEFQSQFCLDWLHMHISHTRLRFSS